MKRYIGILSLLRISILLTPELAFASAFSPRDATPINASTLEGKFLFGYQGFFRRPGQGNDHWSINFGEIPGPSNPGAVQFDTFPAVEQYPEECLFETRFILPDGSKAKLFESNCTGIVDTHFRWMAENSIDGILVQRFYNDRHDDSFVQLLGQVRTAAEKWGRGFAVEYDLSQISSDDFDGVIAELQADYANVVAPLVASPAYLHHGGRPVLELWGFGIASNLRAPEAQQIFSALRSANPNPYVVLGVQQAWRADKTERPDFYNVYTQADVIQPWTVGSYGNDSYGGFYSGTTVPDKQLTDGIGLKYSPVIWPGGSDRNRQGGASSGVPFGSRYNGTFYTNQLDKAVIDLKPFFVFGAMFDEYPESTQAIATLTFSEVPPDPNPGFTGIDDGWDHNYYLQIAGRYAVRYHELFQ